MCLPFESKHSNNSNASFITPLDCSWFTEWESNARCSFDVICPVRWLFDCDCIVGIGGILVDTDINGLEPDGCCGGGGGGGGGGG